MALKTASCRGHLNVVQYLLQVGANVNRVASDGTTALHSACQYAANVQVVEELIKAGAQVDAEDFKGGTPLLWLLNHRTKRRQRQLYITRLLLAAGCNVNAADAGNCTPLYYACGYDDNEEVVTMLIGAGANLINSIYNRILHRCVESNAINKVRILLNHGINLYLRNHFGETALHVAVSHRRLDIMRLFLQYDDDCFLKDGNLIQQGHVASCAADNRSVDPNNQQTPQKTRLIDCQNHNGQTVLHYAATSGSLELLQELLNWMPDIKIESLDTDRCFIALYMAVRQIAGSDNTDEKLDILRCLIEHPNGYGPEFMFYRVRALFLAIEQEDYNLTVIEYLSNIADLRIRNVDGNTALHLAAKRCRARKVMYVLLCSPYAAKAVNIRSSYHGTTVLHDAIIHGRNSNTVRAIAKMANVSLPDLHGKTPLHYAITASNPNYVCILLHRMADVCIRDHDGNTAFVLACCGVVVTQTKKTQLSNIYELYRHGIAYGELSNMV